MKKLFISTTDNIDNGTAIAYYGVVTSHIVAGTGFLSDFVASVSDFFGGRSGSYRKQLESLYEDAMEVISDKAHKLGANAILGLKIDIENISGKGMSLFMITAIGTAAKIEIKDAFKNDSPNKTITSTLLLDEIAKRAIMKTLSDNVNNILPSKAWDTILKSPDDEYIIPLTKRYFQVITHAIEYQASYIDNFEKNYDQFALMSNRSFLIKAIYKELEDNNTYHNAIKCINKYQLFDAKAILELIKNGFVKQAVSLLNIEQPYYSNEDLQYMKLIIDNLEHLPDVGKREIVKTGIFSKDSEKYICQHGHKNDIDIEFCKECGENIKGLERIDLKNIEAFKQKVTVLGDLFTDNR